jgi:hypothetical protein
MKKIALILILALVTPFTASAAIMTTSPGIIDGQTGSVGSGSFGGSSIVPSGSSGALGCGSSGSMGGSLAGSLGSTLANIAPGIIQNLAGGLMGGGSGGGSGSGAGGQGSFGNGGGQLVSNNTGFSSPTATPNPNQFTSASSAYTSDNVYATDSVNGHQQAYGSFGMSVPTDATVDGIEVSIEAKSSAATGCQVGATLSWDGGISWTAQKIVGLTNNDGNYTLGGTSDTWGHTWNVPQTAGGSLLVRLQDIDPGSACADNSLLSVDRVQARVTYSTIDTSAYTDPYSGGSSYGGGSGAGNSQFAPLISSIQNVLGGKLSSLAQSFLGNATGAAGSAAAQAASSAVTGAGSETATGAAGSAAGAGAEVPVRDQQLRIDTSKIKEYSNTTQAKVTSLEYKECVADPQTQRIKQQAIAMLTQSVLGWAANGFNGGPAFYTAFRDFIASGAQAIVSDVINNQLPGLCSPNEGQVKQMIIAQYQYQDNFGAQVQCPSGTSNSQKGANYFYDSVFAPQTSDIGTYLTIQDQINAEIESFKNEKTLSYISGEGYKDVQTCDQPGDITDPSTGECIQGHIKTTSSDVSARVKQAEGNGLNQLLNADEISELVNGLMASLDQVILQGVNGLLGLSQNSSGGQGSYLDNLVDESTANDISGAQGALGDDIDGSLNVEQDYHDILVQILDNLTETRSDYQRVNACYVKLSSTLSGGISNQTALERAQLASSTITQILTPQITLTSANESASADAIDQLQILRDQLDAAQTTDDVNSVAQSYQQLIAAGAVHTTTDITFLENDLAAGAVALQTLNIDAAQKLNECNAYH